MKIGDLVEFTYGRVGGQIEGMGIFAGYGNDGKHKVLFHGKAYWVPEQLIKTISIARKDPANEPVDN